MLFCVTSDVKPSSLVNDNLLLLQTVKSRQKCKSLSELSLSHKIAIFSGGHIVQGSLQSVVMKCLFVLHQVFLPVCGILTNITLEVFDLVVNRHLVLCQSVSSRGSIVAHVTLVVFNLVVNGLKVFGQVFLAGGHVRTEVALKVLNLLVNRPLVPHQMRVLGRRIVAHVTLDQLLMSLSLVLVEGLLVLH